MYGMFGGRLYGSFQNINKEGRRNWQINGEDLTEIDISGCFLTIYMKRVGQPLDHVTDPYAMEWPQRDIVKAYINGSLGAGKLLSQWPPLIVDRLENPKDEGVEPIPKVRQRFRIPAVRDAILKARPSLAKIEEVGLKWGNFHYIESEVIFATIERLAYDYGIAAIPIHDAIFVPTPATSLARRVLIEKFELSTGSKPKIKSVRLSSVIAEAA